MISLLQTIIFFVMLLMITSQPQPQKAPWANVWSQSFISTNIESHLQTAGTLWYDWTYPGMRYDFANSLAEETCNLIYPQNTPCTFLVNSRLFFLIYPQKRWCGNYGIIANVPQPDLVVQFSSYLDTKSINGVDYYLWNNTGYYYRNFMTTSDQKQIYFKQIYTEQDVSFMDYIVNSYTQKVDSKIFDIPKYCGGRNMHKIPNQIQQNLIKNMKQKLGIQLKQRTF